MNQRQNSVSFECTKPIVLVGMMGVGKTTVGRRLALRLKLPFVDADEEIEKAAGMSVSDLFATHGEESFRKGEQQILARLIGDRTCVVATGGGAVIAEATRALLAEKALTIWLRADPDTILSRATLRDTRPLLRTGDPRETIRRLIDERTPFYASADLHIDCADGPHDETVDYIIERLDDYHRDCAADKEIK